jgi:hypothetical protein
MKNILKGLAVTAAVVGMSGGVAAAESFSCTITNTGSGSVNTCVNEQNNTTTLFCSNDVDFNNSNVQKGQSGTVTLEGNGSGGSATSGNVSNENLTSAAVELGCGEVAVTPTPETPTTPSTPQVLAEQVTVKPVGGAGAGAGAGATTNNVAAAAGILGSTGLIALGLALRKRAFNA